MYFRDDTYVPITHSASRLPRRAVAELLTLKPDDWSAIYPGDPLAKFPGHLVFGGRDLMGGGRISGPRAGERPGTDLATTFFGVGAISIRRRAGRTPHRDLARILG